MRERLKKLDWHVYNLSVSDYDYTVELVDQIILDRKKQIDQKVNVIIKKSKKSVSQYKDDTGEEISDIRYYAYIDEQFLWHFALWRLQGIFEGILTQNFLENKKYFGLKSKINALKKANYKLTENDYKKLLLWASLRNALSHLPPEQYNPGPFERSDILEYLNLIKRISSRLFTQKKKNDR